MVEGTAALTMNPPMTIPQRLPAPLPAQRPVRTPAAPDVRERPRTKAPAKRVETSASARSIMRALVLFVGAMALLLFIVYNYMQLSMLSNENRKTANQIHTLKKEESVLNRRAEAGVSLSEVEGYAIGELGMVKPTRDQIVYVGTPARDHAEVIQQTGFWGSVKNLFSTMTGRVIEFLD
ncbi:MAG: hypothetical protein FWG31_01040 [Oscillospiraceae bacterium]|nr:hypothetical protein [Oscillospiraceae bacterium]